MVVPKRKKFVSGFKFLFWFFFIDISPVYAFENQL